MSLRKIILISETIAFTTKFRKYPHKKLDSIIHSFICGRDRGNNELEQKAENYARIPLVKYFRVVLGFPAVYRCTSIPVYRVTS